jgi:hypothetical protein
MIKKELCSSVNASAKDFKDKWKILLNTMLEDKALYIFNVKQRNHLFRKGSEMSSHWRFHMFLPPEIKIYLLFVAQNWIISIFHSCLRLAVSLQVCLLGCIPILSTLLFIKVQHCPMERNFYLVRSSLMHRLVVNADFFVNIKPAHSAFWSISSRLSTLKIFNLESTKLACCNAIGGAFFSSSCLRSTEQLCYRLLYCLSAQFLAFGHCVFDDNLAVVPSYRGRGTF